MSGFENVTIGWKGTGYSVPPDRCMGLLARIEEVLAPPGSGVNALDLLAQPHKAHLTKLARAYAVALRYAGCQVKDEEVYLSVSRDVMKGGQEGYHGILTLAHGLLFMFFPDWSRDEELAQGEAGNETGTTSNEPSGAASSDTSMKSPSEAGG